MKRTLALFVSASLLLAPLTAGLAESVDENAAARTEGSPAAENSSVSEAAVTEQVEAAAAESPLNETQEAVSVENETVSDALTENEVGLVSEQTEPQDETSDEKEEAVAAVQEDMPEADEEIQGSGEVPSEEECETVQAAETNASSSYLPITFAIGDDGKYQCVVTGFSAEDADTIRGLLQNATATVSTELNSIVDAEKISLDPGTDSLHCWAGSSSNMLWMSGWAQQCVNPLTGKTFGSEDEVFDYFRSRMTDGGGSQVDGITWFLDGVFSQDNDDDPESNIAHLKGGASENDGLMKNISAGAVMTRYEGYAVNTADMLDTAMQALADGDTVGLCINGHALTILGYICDPSAKGTKDYYQSLIIADSDNSVKDYTTPAADRPNTATIYTLKYLDDSEEYEPDWFAFSDYTKGGDRYLQEYIVLKRYSEQVVEQAAETDETATLDAQNTADLVIEQVYFTNILDSDQNFCNLNMPLALEDQAPVYVGVQVKNQSGVTCAGDVYARITITREEDGESHVVDLAVNGGTEIGALGIARQVFNISDYFSTLLGTYHVTAEINPDGGTNARIQEAYYKNNTYAEVLLKVIEEIQQKEKEGSSSTSTAKRDTVLIPDNNGICLVPFGDDPWGIHVIMDASGLRGFEVCTGAGDTWETVPEDAYSVVLDTDGTFRLDLTEDYAVSLGEGVHTFRVNLNGVYYAVDITVSFGTSSGI